MLAIQKRAKYFSKVITMPNGIEALVVFELIERNGCMIAKAVYAESIDTNTVPEQEVCCLPGITSPVEFIPIRSIFYSILDTFSRDYSFVKSQPTRAPSF
jgi:hypothetical protein